jgi:myo-inositol catabolism protein IolS
METRSCGESGVEVSVLGIGCWSFGGAEGDYWGARDQRDADTVVAAALDCGVCFFDTAEGYNDGRSEEALGRALTGRRGRAVIATKVSPHNAEPGVLREHCEASLRRLRTDYVDVYMLHWPIRDRPLADALAALAELKAAGKIRAIGVSNFGPRQLTEALDTGAAIDVNQVNYSLLSRAIEFEILPLCRRHGAGVLAYSPLMQGLLTGKYRTFDELPPVRARTRHFSGHREGSRHGQAGAEALVFRTVEGIRALAAEVGMPMTHLALGWCIARSGVASVLAGTRNVSQLRQNAAAAAAALDEDVVGRLDELTDELKAALGPGADYYTGVEDSRTE